MAEPETTPVHLEKALEDLEAIVKQLEGGDLNLEESLALFERGVGLSAACRQQITEAEAKVEMILRRGERLEIKPLPE